MIAIHIKTTRGQIVTTHKISSRAFLEKKENLLMWGVVVRRGKNRLCRGGGGGGGLLRDVAAPIKKELLGGGAEKYLLGVMPLAAAQKG